MTDSLIATLDASSTESPDDLFLRFIAWLEQKGISLYPAQEDAILELFTGQHVILKTPTGSGKSMVALALHFLGLAQKKRSVYTAPIKALVNEKFLSLCEDLGPENVGMLTGDTSVNPDAPILCCTAEILANMSLREGKKLDFDYVIMDEFHFYADRERGWAWQVPLLLLESPLFLLMSATLGDTTEIEAQLEASTGKAVSCISSEHRPVPLEFSYSTSPLHEKISALVNQNKSPIYLVNFTQREAGEQAQNLMSLDFTSRDDKKAISEALKDIRFDTPFGATMERHLRQGIGLHHGGLLPKYRLAVEKLARMGLLKVISGTDTLGVGVNIPIRSVLFTKLCKYDGQKTRLLSVREFKQIAGRAGRRGYDDRGWVIAQAPEHVIENLRLEQKAASQKGGKRKIVRKSPPTKGYVPWNEDTLKSLSEGQAEVLESTFQVNHAMLLELLQREDNPYFRGGGMRRLVELIAMSHERDYNKKQLRRTARHLFQGLRTAGLLEIVPAEYWRGKEVVLSTDLQIDFSLMQSLSLFLVEALSTLSPDSPSYALDVLSFCEAVLENPYAILYRQLSHIKDEAMAAWKAEGLDYEERMRRLEELTWPKPKAELLYPLFNLFETAHPWVGQDNIHPKSIMRDMLERYMSFNEYVNELGLKQVEGSLLRYLSEGFKTLVKTVPQALRNDDVMDVIAFFRQNLAKVDASLIEEWERLMYGDALSHEDGEERIDITKDKKALRARIRADLHALTSALAKEDYLEACENLRPGEDFSWDEKSLKEAMSRYYEHYDRLIFDHHARLADKSLIQQVAPFKWEVQQILQDPEDHQDFAIFAEVDLKNDQNPSGPLIELVEIRSL